MRAAVATSVVFLLPACESLRFAHDTAQDAAELPRVPGDEIVVCGERFHVGAPVVLWTEPPYYDASRPAPAKAGGEPSATRLTYQPGRVGKDAAGDPVVWVEPDSTDVARLAEVVDQFVLHYDACGVSRSTFDVLQRERGLSVHFLLDIDGTIYQTLDLRDQAFHATKANARSIGIEIANLGAYPLRTRSPLDEWYKIDAAGPYIAVPARLGDGGVRTQGFVGRPARAVRVPGTIQGQDLEQFDLTPQQYESLIRLTAGLCRVFPRIAIEAPRAPDGSVQGSVLTDLEFQDFRGILGHYHVQVNKIDPGPAFAWDVFLERVRAIALPISRPIARTGVEPSLSASLP